MAKNCVKQKAKKLMKFLEKYFILFLFLFFLITLGLYWFYVSGDLWNFSNKATDWANFGSYGAGVFTGITFLAVIYQVHLLRKSQEKQDFERTFFMMLEQHNLKLNTLEVKEIDNIYTRIVSSDEGIASLRNECEFQRYSMIYSEINSYFLLLYRVLKFIYDNKELNSKNNYSSLLRSFISNKLLVILCYHLSHRDDGYKKYIKYINEFSLLEHINLLAIEIELIHRVTDVDKKALYDLFLDKDIDVERWDVEIESLIGDTVDSGIRKETLREIIQCKRYKRPFTNSKLYLDFKFSFVVDGSYVKNEINYGDHILLNILKNFSSSAFGENKEYKELIIIYKNIIGENELHD